MNNLKLKYYLYIFKKSYLFLILEILLLSITSLFLSCVTYNTAKLDNLSHEDYNVYSTFGFVGITIQSYLFPFIFLIATIFILTILFNNLILNNIHSVYFLLFIKGYTNIKIESICIHFFYSLITSLSGILLYFILYSILNLIFKTKVPIFTFNINVLYLIASFLIYDSIVYFFCLHHKNKPEKLLEFLREKY